METRAEAAEIASRIVLALTAKQIGNSVATPVAAAITKSILGV